MRLLKLPTELPPGCDCENQAHDTVAVSPSETHHACRACGRSVAVIHHQPKHPTAAATPGVKGGQAHSGAELDGACWPLVASLLGAAAIVVLALVTR